MDTLSAYDLIPEKLYDGDRYPDREWEPCYLCERPVVVDRAHYRIEAIDSGETLICNLSDDERATIEERDDYHGTHAIGPSCRKKLPQGFAVRVKGWTDL